MTRTGLPTTFVSFPEGSDAEGKSTDHSTVMMKIPGEQAFVGTFRLGTSPDLYVRIAAFRPES